MNATLIKEFQNRIVTASQNDLVVINYEMLMAELDEAIGYYNDQDEKGFAKAMTQATRLLRELSDNLDFRYEISKDLMSLYIFVNKKFIDASMTNMVQPLYTAKDVLSSLLLGWREASAKEVTKGPLIQNSQQLYAGLTYGKGSLNETVYQESNRGYRA